MKRFLTVLLVLAMALSLAACGGNNDTQQNNSQNDGQNSVQDDVGGQNDAQQPDEGGDEDADVPGDEEGDVPVISGGDEAGETDPEDPGAQEDEEPEQAAVTASHSDVTFRSAGSSFKLTPKGVEGTYAATYTSDDPAIAAVAEDGTVTAVAPGTTKVHMHIEGNGSQYDFSCIIRCSWEESASEEPETPDEEPAADGVDLNAFYETIVGQYEFGFLTPFEGEILENYYPGMSAIDTKQCLVMGVMMTMNNGEFCLVEVSDSADVDAVKAIFQTRIDGMVNGGAWYPGPTEQWTNNSRVVSNGNYVMMVVHESCDDIVTAFNGLFA